MLPYQYLVVAIAELLRAQQHVWAQGHATLAFFALRK